MKRGCIVITTILVFAGWTVSAEPKVGTNSPVDLKRPLVMFIGDSLSAGGKSHPDAQKFPTWSYVEAMKVLTEKTNCVYRFDKRAAGGNSICGQFAGLMGFFKNVTGNGKEPAPEGLSVIVFQDSATLHKPAPDEYEAALRKAVEYVEKKPDVKLVICTTAFEGRKDGDELQEAWKKINVVFRRVAEEKKLPVIPLDISWPRYIEWYKAKKLPLAQEKNWRITGERMDTVHPGHLGAIFMAINIARELGIPPEQLDIENSDLGADKTMVKEIRDFVYSWKEPPALALPEKAVTP